MRECQCAFSLAEAITEIANAHIEFERIHPFKDGNGRTGRIVMNQMLLNKNVLPAAIDHTSKYRQAFKAYDNRGDNSLMVYLICDASNYSANSLKEYEAKREHDQEK
ncbi:MAG: Fic family protein [Christensenellaceae bacterium]